MMPQYIRFFCILFCFSSWGQELFENIQKPLSPSWKAHYSITSSHDRISGPGLLSKAEISGKFKWTILHNFSVNGEVLLVGRRGFIQSLYDRSDRRNGLHLVEGYFKWDILPDLFYIRLGDKKQDSFKAPLLMTDKTFSSLAAAGDFQLFKNISLEGLLQISVPDNAIKSLKREINLSKEIPYVLTTSTVFEWEKVPFLFDSILKNNLTFFYFTDLTSAVAKESKIGGNSIDKKKDDSEFRYKFYGLHNTFQTKTFISSNWIVEAGYDFLHNFGAPNKYNQGERFFASLYNNFQDFMEIKLTGAYFANQSDSSVAFYNTEDYGHNNRKGWFIKLENHLYESGITFGISYVDSIPINWDTSQIQKSRSLMFFIGTNYVQI